MKNSGIRRLLALSIVSTMVLLAGCAPSAPAAPTATVTVTVTPSGPTGPYIAMEQPVNGSTIGAGAVTVRVDIANFDLGPDDGKIIYYIDAEPPTTPDKSALTAEGTYAVTTVRDYTWSAVAPGKHTFAVQLATPTNNAVLRTGAVIAKATVTVQVGGEACD